MWYFQFNLNSLKGRIYVGLLMVLFFSLPLLAGTYSGGSGTQADPYQIATLNDLQELSSTSADWNKYFIQTANIDASATSGWNGGQGFQPIGSGSTVFTGTYDGQNHTISGLFINRNISYIGFFGRSQGAYIKNLSLFNLNITGGSNTGGIIGFSNSSTLTDCSTNGVITGENYSGGLIGGANGSTIDKCFSNASISGINAVGGLVGFTQVNALIKESYANGSVVGSNYDVGGLVGYLNSSNIQNCYARGPVSGNVRIGGLVGNINNSAIISKSYSTGTVTANSNGGGLVGYRYSATVSLSFWDRETSGLNVSAGGTGLTTASMQTLSTFTSTGWDFASIWEMSGNNYPTLRNNPEVTPQYAFTLRAAANGYSDLDNLAGVNSTASDSFDAEFDIPEPPQPPNNYTQLYFPHPEYNFPLGPNFTSDIRAMAALDDSTIYWDFEVATNQAGAAVTLTIAPDANVPAGYTILLQDDAGTLLKTIRSGSGTVDSVYTYTAGSGAAPITNKFRLIVGDNTPPTVTVTSPNGGEAFIGGDTVTVNWTATDGSGILSNQVFVSLDGGATFTVLDTLAGNLNSYQWVVPGELLSQQIFFKVTSEDSMFHTASDTSDAAVSAIPLSNSVTVNSGWSLISTPFIPANAHKDSVIGDDVNGAYYLFDFEKNSGYSQSDSVLHGQGYWLGLLDAITLDVDGAPALDSVSIPLSQSWNIIGQPTLLPVDETSLLVDSAGTVLPFADAVGRNWVVNAFYTYPGVSGGYTDHDTLQAWNGYWFLALEPNLNLIFPKVLAGNMVGNPPLPQAETEWFVNIQAQSGEAVDNITAFGASNLATAGFDAAFDQPESPKPPIPNAISVYFSHPEWNLVVDRFNRDMQTLLEPGETREWEFMVDGLGDVTLSWEDISVDAHQFTLVDIQKSQSIDMRQQQNYTYNAASGLRAFRVIVHHSPTTGILNNGITPEVFALSQNYPNPFNPSTEIQFQVPQVSQVSITLFNLLGQKVRTLVNSQMEAGSYKTVWDGRNDFGQKVASGIYIYRMNAGEFSSVKKMILMK